MKISKDEFYKPVVKKKDGKFATLKEVLEKKIIIKNDMSSGDYRDLSIARYKMMDPNKAISVGGTSYTKNRIIKEIERQTEVGEKFIGMQVRFVSMLLEKKNEIQKA
jgi:hypothetical protein